MKKLIILTSIICSATTLFAQSRGRITYDQKMMTGGTMPSTGWAFRVGIGYAAPVAGQIYLNAGYPFNGHYTQQQTAGEYLYNLKTGSLSTGTKINLEAGYFFNEHIGIGLNVNIGLNSKKYEAGANNVDDIGGGVPGNVSTTVQAKTPIILSPGIMLQSAGKAVNVYGRMGIALPVRTTFMVKDEFASAPGYGASTIEVVTYEFSNKFSLGFSGSLGVDFNISEAVSIYVEANVISLSVITKQQELTDYTYNGVSYFSQIPANQKTITRSKTANTATGEYPAFSVPYSTAGINIGIGIKL